MRVALVSSSGRCGISEHSAQLQAAVQAADQDICVDWPQDNGWLDPAQYGADPRFDLLHLNYHRGLHSRWTPEAVRNIPYPVIITFHDTYERQPDALPWDLLALDNVKTMVVHEPCDLNFPGTITVDDGVVHHNLMQPNVLAPKVHYWRQPVPLRTGEFALPFGTFLPPGPWRPTLGTVGFDFPWKNYDLLAKVTGELGWNLRIVGQVQEERQLALRALNPRIVFDGWVDTGYAIAALEQCDATAFLYSCANSGTSGAIRLGIAAGRPLIATDGCRQFRDLRGADYGIQWRTPNAEELRKWLTGYSRSAIPTLQGYDTMLLALAEQESWVHGGRKYAELYKAAANG